MSPRKIQSIAKKEYYHLIRDFRSLYLAFFIPLLLILLFGYALSLDVENVKTVVVDHDQTAESRRFIQGLDSSAYFRVIAHLRDADAVAHALDHNLALLGVIIPPDWTENLKKDRKSPLQILIDGSDPNYAGITRSYVNAYISENNQDLLIRFLNRRGLEQIETPIEGRVRVWFNEDLESQNFYVPGIVAFLVMLLSLLLTSMAIVREKEAGTMEQLTVTPMKPLEMILGKTIPFIIISQAQMMMVIAFAVFWFRIPLVGSIPLLLGTACVFLLSTLGIGLFISTVSRTQQQAMMTNFFFILPFFMLSGFVFPIANMPRFIQALTYLNPLRHFLIIIRGIFLKGTGMEVLWPQFLWLLGLGLLVFAGAVNRFQKRLD